jgi:hypothetical protein
MKRIVRAKKRRRYHEEDNVNCNGCGVGSHSWFGDSLCPTYGTWDEGAGQ